ncbi:hypothetical protein EV360DRAFT_83385 [Lentinula raphanica]|nr:hypothetical protein EV360DRAFT_83385 [Lentinula raphanica]
MCNPVSSAIPSAKLRGYPFPSIHLIDFYRRVAFQVAFDFSLIMPLNTSGRKTKAQILQERLKKYPKFKALYEQDLKGPYYKRIAKPTQATHDLVKKYWAEYADEVESKNEKSYAKELTVGSPIPPIEYARGFCVYLCGAVQGRCADSICQATLHSYITTLLACWPRYTGTTIPEEYKLQLMTFVQSSELLNVVPPCLGIRMTAILGLYLTSTGSHTSGFDFD